MYELLNNDEFTIDSPDDLANALQRFKDQLDGNLYAAPKILTSRETQAISATAERIPLADSAPFLEEKMLRDIHIIDKGEGK